MIRVLVVDDSALARVTVCRALEACADIQVVGTATDPFGARERILALRPDVVTLDIEMPGMDGLTFLRVLMQHYPIPVVIVSSLTRDRSDKALNALSLGAVDVVGKATGPEELPELRQRLIAAVRAAACAHVVPGDLPTTKPPQRQPRTGSTGSSTRVIGIGASTGGTRAIEQLLTALPAPLPGIVIAQHMPGSFSGPFARRLDECCEHAVREARDGDAVLPGTVLIAPGDTHMRLERAATGFMVRLEKGPPVRHVRPSVDILFDSIATVAGAEAMGILLTGMGSDGARGLLKMRSSGAFTLAEDESSCTVFGMPRVAISLGAVEKVVPLEHMASAILKGLGHRLAASS